jgi:hypothetical protein
LGTAEGRGLRSADIRRPIHSLSAFVGARQRTIFEAEPSGISLGQAGYKKGNDPGEEDRADLAWLFVPESWAMPENDLNRDPPELIVDTSPSDYHDFGRYPIKDYPILRSFVDRNCRLEKSIAGIDIYRCGKKTS